jgi:hypothetical protein
MIRPAANPNRNSRFRRAPPLAFPFVSLFAPTVEPTSRLLRRSAPPTLSDIYVIGDDEEAKRRFLALVANTPFRYLDAGRLANARTVERMTLLVGELGVRYGFFPRMNYRLLGEPWKQGQADLIAPLIARQG